MRYKLHFYLSFLMLLLISSTNLPYYLGTTGKISGRVTDMTNGEGIPFVNIVVEGTSFGAASDVNGYFNIINLPPNVFTIKATAIGYNPVTISNIKVSIDLTTNVDIQMSETSITLKSDVVIVAQRPLIQKDLTASTSIVGNDLIKELPVTDVGDVLQLQAGIVNSGGGLHLRGGRSGQIAFQIDGVPVTDAYDGSNVIDVATNSIQELQVVSGAFNAEYGQAMSGIVNIVTKDGDNTLTGSVQAYVGDYASNKKEKFWYIENINPVAIRNFEGSLSGPIVKDQLYFFLNGRYFYNTGYLYGRQTFLTTDKAIERPGSNGSDFIITQSGDSNKYVPMNPNERIFAQGKLTSRLFTGVKLSYNYIIDLQNYKDYNGANRLTPDNNKQRFRKGYTNTLALNHALSASTYYTLNLSYFFKDYRDYLYKDINTNDPNNPTQYVNNDILKTPPYSFNIGGTDWSRFTRNTSTIGAKLDWTTQLTQQLNIQFGIDAKQHQLYMHSITLIPDRNEAGQFIMSVPPITSDQNNEYLHKPQEGSFYIQSKLEAFNLIFNLGVRLDIFNPDGKILSDPTDPTITSPLKPANRFHDLNGNGVQDLGETDVTLAERQAYWYKDAKVKYQFSPRIGLAFPITAKGVIHFSYGHFLQLPPYELMYENPEFELGTGSGIQGTFGNADLNPQKTIKGEIGLQQQIGDDISIDLTMFFEDFRNLTGTQSDEILVHGRSRSYFKYANSDFGFSKGFIVKFEKRFSGGLSTNLDYTYSVTKGNASNPQDARNAIAAGALPETFIAPLNWDQSHTLNISVAYTEARDWGFSMIGNFYSGQPFTPGVNKNTIISQNGFPRNSENKPTIFNLDLRLYKDIPFGNTTISLFLKVFNLLDLDNATGVYDNSGDPVFTFDIVDARKIQPKRFYNTLVDYYNNPTNFSEPRRVEFGLSYNF
ncbi:MAG: TonB-dependent receptor [Ignavibacteriales bacterium]|nr:TonB-dependent receptor [Ignavibacteriales bacterium]